MNQFAFIAVLFFFFLLLLPIFLNGKNYDTMLNIKIKSEAVYQEVFIL